MASDYASVDDLNNDDYEAINDVTDATEIKFTGNTLSTVSKYKSLATADRRPPVSKRH
jgi:hypothetical protein